MGKRASDDRKILMHGSRIREIISLEGGANNAQALIGRAVPATLGEDALSHRLPVLIVLHQAHSTPGHIGHWLQNQGYSLDIRRPALGDSLPDTLQNHTGTIVFGGPMSANDQEDYLGRERRLIELALKEVKACLGVCLGAQLMAQVLGTRVFADSSGRVEIGYFPIEPTAAGAQICDWPVAMYQWHREGFDLPAGARLLARSEGNFPNQAFLYGDNAVGIQFHPEITLAMIYRWTTFSAERLTLPGAKQRQEHIAGHLQFEPSVARWRNDFLAGLLTGGFAERGGCDKLPAVDARSHAALPIS